MGGASLHENWILEGDEQGNFPVNSFVFLSIVFGLMFLDQSLDYFAHKFGLGLSTQRVTCNFPR